MHTTVVLFFFWLKEQITWQMILWRVSRSWSRTSWLYLSERHSLSESCWGPEPGLGAVVLFTNTGDNTNAPSWRRFYVLKVNPSFHSPLLPSGVSACSRFFLRFATECHCCSAVLQPLHPPSVSPEVESHKLTGRESEAAAEQIIALSPAAAARPHLLVCAPLPPPVPETR